MPLDYDPTASLSHYPAHGPSAMRRYGLNPHGEPLYRIVFADSRKHIVTGTWPDNSTGAKYRPRYRHAAGQWIMERWLSAAEYHKMPREKWDMMYPSMPYQERGDYDICHVFYAGVTDSNLDKLIRWIEAGRMGSFQDNRDACERDYAQETKDADSEIAARVNNALPAFGATAISGYGSGRGTKTAGLRRGAAELNLPGVSGAARQVGDGVTGRSNLVQGKRRQRYEVPVKA